MKVPQLFPRMRLYQVETSTPWSPCSIRSLVYVWAPTAREAIAVVKPNDAPDHWIYRAALVRPINGPEATREAQS